MDKKIVLAVAGAGKTYYICESIDPEKKNLILAFTHSNVNNIVKELTKMYEGVPERTSVMTFDAFIYRFAIRPYEPSILEYFNRSGFISKGITFQNPPGQRIGDYPNPNYYKKDKFEHYISKSRQYYCRELSNLIMQTGKGRDKLCKRVGQSINKFFDYIAIDEFQDYRKGDYDFIMEFSKSIRNILLVGDYCQHSVSGVNNSGRPYKNGKKYRSYNEFKEMVMKEGFAIDDKVLKKSRRCGKEICEFVSSKLGISIESHDNHDGKVIVADEELARNLLSEDSIVKLVNKDASKKSFNALNWSYSKGDTMDSVCIILTKDASGICNESFDHEILSPITKNELYVALTRSKGDVYLVTEKIYKKCINS